MRLRLLLLLTVCCLTACGFKLRGEEQFPFNTVYIQSHSTESSLHNLLKQNFLSNQIQVTDNSNQAEVTLVILSESTNKQILSLGGSGRVNEFKIYYRVGIRAYDQQANIWLEDNEIVLHREYSYSDSDILAKEAEEAFLIKNMRNDMARLIMRRLSRAQPQM
ncbi:MAG: hypothetical protein D3905_11760 [Candidatus Electrothrix sp. AS4_5]|nr:hypothetical protein [Candidatus Electrothrix gigas]